MKKNATKNIIFLVILFLGIEFLFFKEQVLNGTVLEALYGDKGDARFCCLILEHYFEVFNGKEAFADLKAFYPVANTISYSDMLLGYAVPFSVLRCLGVNMYSSFNLTIVFFHIIGTVSIIYLLKRKFKLSLGATAIGVVSFSFAASYTSILGHVQFGFIGLLPIILIFLLSYFENLFNENKKKRMLSGYLAILSILLLLYSSFYLAYFFVLFFIIVVITFFACISGRKNLILQIRTYVCKNKMEIFSYILMVILFIFPFFKIYLPTLKATGGYDLDNVLQWTPHFYDIFSVSKSNLLMGSLMKNISVFKSNNNELILGFPMVVVVLFLVSLLKLIIDNKNDYRNIFFKTISISTVVLYLLFIQVNGHLIWEVFCKVLPGATAMRALGRVFFFMIFPVSLVLSYVSDLFLKEKKMSKLWYLLLIFLVIVSNYDKKGVGTYWSTEESLNFEAGIKEPPKDCEVMFIVYEGTETNSTNVQTLSWSIAEKYDLKCINGYSGNFPSGWGGIYNVFDKDVYLNEINVWITHYELENVYAYNMAENEWIKWD